MTTGANPYVVPVATDTDDPASPLFETTFTADHTMGMIIGPGFPTVNGETFNGTIPGPTLKVDKDASLVVRLKNNLHHDTGIHWHGVEMANKKDGTPFTQDPVKQGHTYLYKLRFPRAGLYWYHPHSHSSMNQVFKGMYGAIVVTDQAIEQPLLTPDINNNTVIPTDTQILVLSDVTVCTSNSSQQTFPNANTLPWVGPGGFLPAQPQGATPEQLCSTNPLNEMGGGGTAFAAGDIPNIQKPTAGPVAEGQTVLTNGMFVGGRPGSPTDPTNPILALPPGTVTRKVTAGQGLRLQIFNMATIRYMRLILTVDDQTPITMYRIGGEGGLLNQPVIEGGTINGFDTQFNAGEILLPAGSRADVVVTIPNNLLIGRTLTLWTQDYKRLGGGTLWANLPTVPVMHLEVDAVGGTFFLDENVILRSGANAVPQLVAATGNVLQPSTFGKDGSDLPDIELTAQPGVVGIDHIAGSHDVTGPYAEADKIDTARYVKPGDIVELTARNATTAHHPFHLHGFSMQPKSLTGHATDPDFFWPYDEFRDNIDIPPGYKLTFLIHIDDTRPLVDDVTPGGSMGRWMFHCHIFFHAHLGMLSELIVTTASGAERPYVDVNGSWAYGPNGTGGMATRTGSYSHPDGLPVTLTPTEAPGTPIGTIVDLGGGKWSWSLDTSVETPRITYVYITATDNKLQPDSDQAVFRLKIGGQDDGADTGDPHIHTVDGKRYDFQAAGEFTLLRDLEEGLEVQARQTPVKAANPITDSYSGLQTCVSINTAVAARVGRHRIAYQPTRDPKRLQLFIDGEPADIPREGLDLGEHRLTAQAVAGGGVALRVDYANQAVLTITPNFWTSYGVWYLDVSVARTQATDGVMGRILPGTWLPALPNGNTVGPKPASLHDRYVALYRTFADAWRVTRKTSLFVYAPGTSTETFTDREWPAEKPPCKLQPQFEIPGAKPPKRGLTVREAERVCRLVTIDGLRQDCVFDVATTGDRELARGYEQAQELRLHATAVRVATNKPRTRLREEVVVTASVSNLYREAKEPPQGEVTFFIDGERAGTGKLDERSQASIVLRDLKLGEHPIRAEYAGGGDGGHHSSSSPNLLHLVARDPKNQPQRADQLLPHVLDVPAPDGHGKHTGVELDVKTARRMLKFINAASRPEDLLQPPEVLTHLHVEYRKRGFPEVHPPAHADDAGHARPVRPVRPVDTGHHGEAGPPPRHAPVAELVDERLAIEVLTRRNDNPVYGFTRISELFDIARIRKLLEVWWYAFSRASKGEWTGPYTIPGGAFDRPVHAAVLRTGKVLFFGLPTGKDSWLWTPNGAGAGTTAPTANKPADSLFCAGHAFLSDGRLLVVGGGGDGTGPRHNHGWIFDPVSQTWTRTAGNGTPGNGDMAYHRWYPTLIMMGDEPGRVLVVSGDDTSGTDVRQMEMYMESTDRFELVWGPAGVGDTSAEHSFPQIYPAMNLLPGGEVFYTPTGWHSGGCSGAADYPAAKPSGFFEFSSTAPTIKASWTDIGTQDAAAEATIDRVKGMAVLILQPSYPFVQALVVGGGKDPESATTFQMINLSTLVPKWGPPVTLPDGLSRVNVNLVALPDGTVFVSGGRPLSGTPADGGACWIYNPVTMTWQECDALARRRGYHSVAVLLPDGRVATAGNECPSDTTYEIFSPPYLFASDGSLAPRPVITSLPAQVHHGHTFTIQTPSPSTIAKVVLVKPMAVTHQTDSEQRVVQLTFGVTGPNALSATAPNGWHPHGLAPRAWYMVFLVDNHGVPSVGRFMHLH